MMTYRETYLWGCRELKMNDVPDAEYDARLLLESVCKTTRTTFLTDAERAVTDDEYRIFADLIARRAAREPLQQILGETCFMGLDFLVSEDVLCPRMDTEILVEEALKYLHDGMRVLDVCTGSGCILLSLMHYSNDCSGVGIDLSEKALSVARANAEKLELTEKVRFLQGDLFDALEKTGGENTFEILVSNPPYIPTAEIAELMPEVRDHEPMMALDGSEDGLLFYRRIIRQAPDYLCGGGVLLFEIGAEQGNAVSGLMQEAGFLDVRVLKDYAGLDRVVCGIRPSL